MSFRKSPAMRTAAETKARRGSFHQTLKNLAPSVGENANSSGRIFSALYSRKYAGPNIDESLFISKEADEQIRQNTRRVPVFMDGNGALYDIDYIPIDTYDPEKFHAQENGLFVSGAEVFNEFPDPNNFQSYSEYNQYYSQWYSKMTASIGKLKLPLIMGSAYYRPRADIVDNQQRTDQDTSEVEGIARSADADSAKDSPHLLNSSFTSDIEDEGLDIEFESDKDPWQTCLIPPEPQPDLYNTFECYEQAMKRWAVVCAKQLSIIPPHPSQLNALILLNTATERRAEERKRGTQSRTIEVETATSEKNTMEEFMQSDNFVREQDSTDQFAVVPLPQPDISFSKAEFERNFSSGAVLSKVSGIFEEIYNKRKQNEETYNNPIPPATGTRQFYLKNRSSFRLFESREFSETDTPVPAITVPRDHAGVALDLENESDRYQLYLVPDNLERVKLKELADPEYAKSVRDVLDYIENQNRFDRYYAWLNDGQKVKKSIKFAKMKPESFVKTIRAFLLRDDYLDSFHERLNIIVEQNTTTFDLLSVVVQQKPILFIKLINLYDKIQSPLSILKLSHLIGRFLQRDDAVSILTFTIENGDCYIMYKLARLINNLGQTSVDIYSIHASTFSQASAVIPLPQVEEITNQFLFSYYCHQILMSLEKKPAYSDIIPHLDGLVTKVRARLSHLLNSNLSFLMIHLFKLVGHHNKHISFLYLVITLHIFDLDEKTGAEEIMAREEVGFLENVRKLCQSKLTHVRFAASRIMEKLKSDEKWRTSILRSYYRKNPDCLEHDIFTKTRNNQASFLSTAIIDFTVSEFLLIKQHGISPASASNFSYLLRGGRQSSSYRYFLDKIKSDTTLLSPITAHAATFLRHSVETFYDLDLLEGYENIEAAEKSLNSTQGKVLLIIPEDATEILDFITDNPADHPLAYQIKRDLLKVVTVQIRHSVIFDFIRKDKNFFTRLIRCCRDGKDMAFNEEAWQFFFVLVKYHHGVIPFMDSSNKLLNQLMELISPGVGNVVTTNCLNFMANVLDLCDKEQVQLQETGKNSRGDEDIKLIERDVKLFVSHLVKHCLKVHLICKRLQFNDIDGAPFLSVANFYNTVNNIKNKNQINGNKLYKEITKNADYKKMLTDVVYLYSVASIPVSRTASQGNNFGSKIGTLGRSTIRMSSSPVVVANNNNNNSN